ncbi:hypothetical protein QBC36DRAFT_328512 [Triangularia setosa]|uniref:Uncharacterized protein n=1 Tax=Triangularia setosa TaxID=2587417 RepID=A0AAN6W7D7_9PEZI|nr:hypothetical protein QBC36DRAFT_328512 [Podospora setosa]
MLTTKGHVGALSFIILYSAAFTPLRPKMYLIFPYPQLSACVYSGLAPKSPNLDLFIDDQFSQHRGPSSICSLPPIVAQPTKRPWTEPGLTHATSRAHLPTSRLKRGRVSTSAYKFSRCYLVLVA